jgi:hypothetical protein
VLTLLGRVPFSNLENTALPSDPECPPRQLPTLQASDGEKRAPTIVVMCTVSDNSFEGSLGLE